MAGHLKIEQRMPISKCGSLACGPIDVFSPFM
jgi:hypothetical protein